MEMIYSYIFVTWFTIKLMYNDHSRDPPNLWPLLKGGRCSEVALCYKDSYWDSKNGGHCRQVVATRRWSLAQVWLYFDLSFNRTHFQVRIFAFQFLAYAFLAIATFSSNLRARFNWNASSLNRWVLQPTSNGYAMTKKDCRHHSLESRRQSASTRFESF
jgi:hypothetical protein